jgi:Zn-dependent peptidase ImmA (M78 family)
MRLQMTRNDLVNEKVVAGFRAKYQLGEAVKIDFESLLLKLNVVTVFLDMSMDFSGMSLKLNDNKFMLVNSAQNIGRQNFTIGHELYHLFIQANFESHKCQIELFQKKTGSEYVADSFSANLLMPRAGLLELIPENELKKDRITLRTILYIENYFKVSRLALLIRLKSFDLISENLLNSLNKEIIKSATEYGYGDDLYKPGNLGKVIGNYGSLAKELFNGDKISESHYYELMKAIELKQSPQR